MTQSDRRRVVLDSVTGVLLALGIVRSLGVALHRPLFGYANNFDFYRLAQWYGLTTSPGASLQAHPAAPLATYLLGGPRVPGDAYLSSELVFLELAVRAQQLFGRSDGSLNLHYVGVVRALSLVLCAGGITVLLNRRSRTLGAAWAGTFAVVLSDPLVTLFFNTLYCEFAGVFFATLSVGLLVWLHESDHWPWPAVAGCAVSLFGLGLSKLQNQALPFVLVLVATAFWALRRPSDVRRWSPAAASLLAVSLLAFAVQRREPEPGLNSAIRMANATDTWFGAVLPALDDPDRMVMRLGLPDDCAGLVGKTWYDPGMQPAPCPEVARLSRATIIQVLLVEPRALGRLWTGTLQQSRPWIIPGYGQVEGHDSGRLLDQHSPVAASFAPAVDALSEGSYGFALLLGMLVLPATLCALLIRRSRKWFAGSRSIAPFVACLLSAVLGYSFVTTLLGDGFVSFTHHFHLGEVAWGALASCFVSAGVGRVIRAVSA